MSPVAMVTPAQRAQRRLRRRLQPLRPLHGVLDRFADNMYRWRFPEKYRVIHDQRTASGDPDFDIRFEPHDVVEFEPIRGVGMKIMNGRDSRIRIKVAVVDTVSDSQRAQAKRAVEEILGEII